MGTLLLIGAGLVCFVAVVGVFVLVALAAEFAVSRIFPNVSRKWTSFLSAGVLPLAMTALTFAVLVLAVDEEFRGPEVLGLGLLLAISGFALIVAWPLAWWQTYRIVRNC